MEKSLHDYDEKKNLIFATINKRRKENSKVIAERIIYIFFFILDNSSNKKRSIIERYVTHGVGASIEKIME